MFTYQKQQIRVFIFLHCDFQRLILQTIKKYSLLVELNQHLKQLRMDRNNKEINLPKLNSRISVEDRSFNSACGRRTNLTCYSARAI